MTFGRKKKGSIKQDFREIEISRPSSFKLVQQFAVNDESSSSTTTTPTQPSSNLTSSLNNKNDHSLVHTRERSISASELTQHHQVPPLEISSSRSLSSSESNNNNSSSTTTLDSLFIPSLTSVLLQSGDKIHHKAKFAPTEEFIDVSSPLTNNNNNGNNGEEDVFGGKEQSVDEVNRINKKFAQILKNRNVKPSEMEYIIKTWTITQKMTFIKMNEQFSEKKDSIKENATTNTSNTSNTISTKITNAIDDVRNYINLFNDKLQKYETIIILSSKHLQSFLDLLKELAVNLRTRDISFVIEFIDQDGINLISSFLMKVNQLFKEKLDRAKKKKKTNFNSWNKIFLQLEIQQQFIICFHSIVDTDEGMEAFIKRPDIINQFLLICDFDGFINLLIGNSAKLNQVQHDLATNINNNNSTTPRMESMDVGSEDEQSDTSTSLPSPKAVGVSNLTNQNQKKKIDKKQEEFISQLLNQQSHLIIKILFLLIITSYFNDSSFWIVIEAINHYKLVKREKYRFQEIIHCLESIFYYDHELAAHIVMFLNSFLYAQKNSSLSSHIHREYINMGLKQFIDCIRLDEITNEKLVTQCNMFLNYENNEKKLIDEILNNEELTTTLKGNNSNGHIHGNNDDFLRDPIEIAKIMKVKLSDSISANSSMNNVLKLLLHLAMNKDKDKMEKNWNTLEKMISQTVSTNSNDIIDIDSGVDEEIRIQKIKLESTVDMQRENIRQLEKERTKTIELLKKITDSLNRETDVKVDPLDSLQQDDFPILAELTNFARNTLNPKIHHLKEHGGGSDNNNKKSKNKKSPRVSEDSNNNNKVPHSRQGSIPSVSGIVAETGSGNTPHHVNVNPSPVMNGGMKKPPPPKGPPPGFVNVKNLPAGAVLIHQSLAPKGVSLIPPPKDAFLPPGYVLVPANSLASSSSVGNGTGTGTGTGNGTGTGSGNGLGPGLGPGLGGNGTGTGTGTGNGTGTGTGNGTGNGTGTGTGGDNNALVPPPPIKTEEPKKEEEKKVEEKKEEPPKTIPPPPLTATNIPLPPPIGGSIPLPPGGGGNVPAPPGLFGGFMKSKLPKLPELKATKETKKVHIGNERINNKDIEKTGWIKMIDSNATEISNLFDKKLFEENFTKKELSTLPNQGKETKDEVVTFLDAKVSYNISLLLGFLKMGEREIRKYVIELNDSALGKQTIHQLKDLCPDEEKLKEIEGFIHKGNGSLELLQEADRLFYTMKDIPRLKQRFTCWSAQLYFESTIRSVEPDLQSCMVACNRIIESDSLSKMFTLLITIINFLNRPKLEKDKIYGFKVSFLMRLADIKSSVDSSRSILDFVCEFCLSKQENLIPNLAKQLYDQLEVSSRIELPEVKKEIGRLQECLNTISSELQVFKKEKAKFTHDKFPEHLTKFYEEAQVEMKKVLQTQEKLESKLKQLALFFGEKEKDILDQPHVFFQNVFDFVKWMKNTFVRMKEEMEKSKDEQLKKELKNFLQNKRTQGNLALIGDSVAKGNFKK
ncbi:hypothetical protein ABK040_013008 [Willaertia magna]